MWPASQSAEAWRLQGTRGKVGCCSQPACPRRSLGPWGSFPREAACGGGPSLADALARYLKVGYPCCLRFICDESYTVDLFFSTKSRLGGLPGAESHFRAVPWCLPLSRVVKGLLTTAGPGEHGPPDLCPGPCPVLAHRGGVSWRWHLPPRRGRGALLSRAPGVLEGLRCGFSLTNHP